MNQSIVLNAMLHYRGGIKEDREYTVVTSVGNFIHQKIRNQLVINIYVDGGTRGSRICLVDRMKDLTVVKTRNGELTNNELEYLALLYALEYIRNQKSYQNKDINIYSDSKLIVNQVNGGWRVTTEKLIPLYKKCREKFSDNITLKWVPREKNFAGFVLEDK